MTTKSAYPPSVQPGIPKLLPCPNGWVQASLKNYLIEVKEKVKLEDETEYNLVTVKRARGGLVRREHLLGKNISVKSQFLLKEGNFLISKRQIVHGACGIVPKELDGSIVSNEYSILDTNGELCLEFLKYLSHSVFFQQTCFHSSIGVHIEKMIFKLDQWFKFKFNLPQLPEQKKIAEILGTWDKAIDKLDKLIENSKTTKKALMQELLTGKKRLLGFNGDWKEVYLNDLVKISKGKQVNRNTLAKEGSYPVINGGVTPSGFTEVFNTSANTITISEGGNSCGYVSFMTTAFWCGGHCYTLEEVKVNNNFLYQILKYHENRIMRLRVGSGLPNIQKKDLFKLKISITHNGVEQSRIAEILSKKDEEINVLEGQREKLITEKKALMQQLLTGKKRVKVGVRK